MMIASFQSLLSTARATQASTSDSSKPETPALHAGWRADPATGAVAVSIYQTTSYQF